MIPLPLIDGNTLLLDNSTLELFQTCSRAAEYGICHRLKGTGERSPLKFGGIAHKVLEVRYRSGTPMYEQTVDVERAMMDMAEGEFKGICEFDPDGKQKEDPYGAPLWVKQPWAPPEDDFRTYDRMIDLIHKYGEHYPFESFDIVTFPDGRPFLEVPFALPLGRIEVRQDVWVQNLVRLVDGSIIKDGPPARRYVDIIEIVWQGRIDLVYRHNGGLYLMDHKTSSIATNMAEFEISHQFYGYTWAVETLLREQVSGTVINRIVCRRPTRTGDPFTFERKLILTQRGLVTEWKSDILHMCADFVEGVRRGYMPKRTAWCVGKFGTCQFHKVCSNDDPTQRQFLLESGEFEENTWSPLKDNV